MTATAAQLARLQARVSELEAALKAEKQRNVELTAAAEASRNFRASVDAGHTNLDLDNWGNP